MNDSIARGFTDKPIKTVNVGALSELNYLVKEIDEMYEAISNISSLLGTYPAVKDSGCEMSDRGPIFNNISVARERIYLIKSHVKEIYERLQ